MSTPTTLATEKIGKASKWNVDADFVRIDDFVLELFVSSLPQQL